MITVLIFLTIFSDSLTIQKGDEHFRNQDYSGAISQYQNHLNSSPNDAEAYWRITRAYICIGDVSKRAEREQYYRKALENSIAAVRMDSLNTNVQCWYAVSMGYIALFEGSRKKVELCNKIKHALDLSIFLDPRNDVAYSIYGSFYRALGKVSWFERQLANLLLGGLPDGGFEEGEKMLQQAIGLAPAIIRHRYELGSLYFDWGKEKMGKEVFRSALTLPITLTSDWRRMEVMKQKIAGQ